MFEIVYFSNTSENTKRFVEKLQLPLERIPLDLHEPMIQVTKPYILVTPTYGRFNNKSGIPPQVKSFLNIRRNRRSLAGVIAAGNTNFGERYCNAGVEISQRCKVPLIYKFELLGTQHDLLIVKERLEQLWKQFS